MTREQTKRNIDLAFDLVRKAARDPEEAKRLDGLGRQGPFVLLPEDDPELAKKNLELADSAEARGEKTVRLAHKVDVTKKRR